MANTVSVDVAKRLKAAGLEWEPKRGDWFYGPTGNIWVISDEDIIIYDGPYWFFGGHGCAKDGGCRLNDTACFVLTRTGKSELLSDLMVSKVSENLWLPTLSDLLSRLEEMGYMPDSIRCLEKNTKGKNYSCALWRGKSRYDWWLERNFDADTWEDAAGLALIWALGQEGGQT